jgi:hypothetical protein
VLRAQQEPYEQDWIEQHDLKDPSTARVELERCRLAPSCHEFPATILSSPVPWPVLRHLDCFSSTTNAACGARRLPRRGGCRS